MKNYYRIVLVISLVLVSLSMAGCAGIEIQSPPEDRKHLTTMPYDLEVVHTGCGYIVPDSFKAWLDKGEEDEQDITSAFTYGADKWTASSFELPSGTHTFTAKADLDPGPWCMVGKEQDTHEFVVNEPVCITGRKLVSYWYTGDPGCYPAPQPGDPVADAPIEVVLTQDEEVVAEGTSDNDGFFCIDNIPVGYKVNIRIGRPGTGRVHVRSFDPGMDSPRSCLNREDCADLGECIAQTPED